MIFILIYTSGFLKLPEKIRKQIVKKTLERISLSTDFIVFDPECEEERYEDEGRSLILPLNYTEEVYAKLDDYGSPEILSSKLGHVVDTQYVVTFLLPEEW